MFGGHFVLDWVPSHGWQVDFLLSTCSAMFLLNISLIRIIVRYWSEYKRNYPNCPFAIVATTAATTILYFQMEGRQWTGIHCSNDLK